jgi:exportin-5
MHSHRTSNLEPHVRETRLRAFLEPVRQSWQNEEFRNAASSFNGFCQLLGLERVGPYMQARQAQKLENWSSVVLDDEGVAIQQEMTKKFHVREPYYLRLCKLI